MQPPQPFCYLNDVKRFFLLSSYLGLTLATAQAAPAPVLPTAAKSERVEGTISWTRDGSTSRARLQFQAPDFLRIDIERDDAALVPAQTIVAAGDETRLYEPGTKRLHRLPHNIAREWWRGWDLANGGPGNFLIFGLSPTTLAQFYDVKQQLSATTQDKVIPQPGSNATQFNARPGIGQTLVQDFVHFGGSGTAPFYTATQRAVYDRPARIEIDAMTNSLMGLHAFGEAGRALLDADLTVDPASGLPKAAIVHDASGHELARVTYDLKARPEAFPAAVFQTDLAPGQLLEDVELKSISDYEAGQEASTPYNLGAAVARHTEDFPAAFASWDTAARLQPQAVAPHFAIFDAAMQTRDFPRAQVALDALAQLLGESHFEVATHRATLANARRDWKATQAALDAAQQAQPQNLDIMLRRADLTRAQGDFAGARSLLAEILKSLAPQPGAKASAVVMLANMAVTPEDTQATSGIFDALTEQPQWQQLGRAQMLLATGGAAPATNLESDAALAALALAQERAGQDVPALGLWQRVADHALPLPATVARMHLMALQAKRGAFVESLQLYRDLVAAAPDESARRRVEDAFTGSWRKSYHQDQLRHALQQQVVKPDATEADWRLWLALQEAYGSDADIASLVQGALARFPRSAWWQSRRAEAIMDEVASQTAAGVTAAQTAPAIQDALRATQAAIEADPRQPFYQEQRALILTQRTILNAGAIIQDATQNMASLKAARDAVAKLQQDWKDNPDVEIAAALQNVSLEPNDLVGVVQDLQKALRDGRPGRETLSGDRHTTASSVHQTLASLLRRLNKPAEAGRHYEILLEAVRDADTELGLARNSLILLTSKGNATAVAALMMRLTREPWPYAAARTLSDGFADAVAQNGNLAVEVITALRASDDPAAHLAETQLDLALLAAAQAVAALPKATAEAKQTPATIARAVAATIPALAAVGNGPDKLLAGRAAALLSESALNARQYSAAVNWLKVVVRGEPHDLDLRLALAAAYRIAGQPEEAVKTRNDILTIFPHDADTLRRMAVLSSDLKLPQDATREAQQALNIAATNPETPPDQFETIALTAAQILFDAGQVPRAVEIYNQLALPQWDNQGRVLALLDLAQRQRQAGHTAEADKAQAQLQPFHLTKDQLSAAQQMLNTLN